ncbi:MAG TPA: transcriptional regulator [Ruminococcaceae bacterium]|jgi:LacI family sucrose operon transcriptional repressor|nr:transcriptional regulator [Oscillospiraceae bacterium]HCM23819.1 transcriptional regulator [Oscillospiraceae bacterium]
MASIRDVARKAKVAISTVSRVLNNNGYVSEDTRRKVLAAMKELDYMPNEVARNLFHNRTNFVGVMMPDIAHPFFATVTKYIEKELYENGYKVVLCNTVEKSDREKEFVDMLRRRIVDGIIMGAHSLEIEKYRNLNLPIVALDRIIEGIPNICVDHCKGGRLAAQALLHSGCHNVVQIMGCRKVHSYSEQRHIVFSEVMKSHGVQVRTVELAWNLFNFQGYLNVAKKVLDEMQDIDGIFATDQVAMAFIRVLLERGKRIPQDVKVVGYDGTSFAEGCSPSLTTVVQPMADLGKTAADSVLTLIKGGKLESDQILLDVKLKQGNTTL